MAWNGTASNSYGSYGGSGGSFLTQGVDVSRINAAGIICIRVQNCWTKCGRLFDAGNFDGLRDALNILWTEFYADATKDQRKFIVNIDKKIRTAIILRAKNKKNLSKYVFYNELYKASVYDKWLFMKTLEKAQGIGKAYVDKDEDDWD